ncbi:DNA polymerase III subunit delta [Chloroflexota bacterium]
MLLGEDDFSLRQFLAEIKRDVGDEANLMADTTNFDGQKVTLDQLRSVCEAVPFLAEKRLVIVEGLLGRFESRGKPKGKKAARKADRENDCKSIAEYVSQIPQFTVLALVDGKINNRNPLLKELSAKAEVRSFPLMKGAKLHQWIQRRVTEAGGSISPQAMGLLIKFIDGNLWLMANEVDKLVLFAGSRRIEEKDVGALVSYAQEASVFVMVDAILEFKAGVALELMQQLLQQGAPVTYLLVMLARQFRMLVRLKELVRQRKSNLEIQDKLGLNSEYVINKLMGLASRYSMTRLKEMYHRLLEADLAIKTGRFNDELALSILIAELCQGRKV